MIQIHVGVLMAILVWAFCLGWIVCSAQHRAASGASGPKVDPNPLGDGGCRQPRSSNLEMTPAREARLRALNPHFAKAQDQTKAADAWAEKIRAGVMPPQAAKPETPAAGNVRALPNPARKM